MGADEEVTPSGQYGDNSEQHGLVGSSLMKDSTFLDEDKEKVNTRKIKITEALVDAETGKRKIILKKKKKKGV